MAFYINLVSSSQQISESEMAIITSSTHAETEGQRVSVTGSTSHSQKATCPGMLTEHVCSYPGLSSKANSAGPHYLRQCIH